MAAPGISSLGVQLGYSATPANTKPSAFTLLSRINAIGGISLEVEQIDASALEDAITRYVEGRANTGGNVAVTVNVTNDTIDEWQTVFDASDAAGDKGLWFEVYSPLLAKAFFFEAQTPSAFPMPEMGQNELMTVEIPLTIMEYHGLDTAVKPGAAA